MHRNRRSEAIVFASALAAMVAVVISPAAANDQFYNMVCRAGPGMSFSVTPYPKSAQFSAASQLLDIVFAKAGRGFEVDPARLESGQCTWLDRRIARDEPAMARFSIRNRGKAAGGTGGRAYVFESPPARRETDVKGPIAFSFVYGADGVQVNVVEATTRPNRPYHRIANMFFLDGRFFTKSVRQYKEGRLKDMKPRNTPFLAVQSIKPGAVLNDGKILQINERGEV